MKKNYLLPFLLMMGYGISAQVGINTTSPKSTLHVEGRPETTAADGIIPPRLSGDLLRSKSAAYGPDQNGAIVYVTSAVTNPNPTTEPKTQDVGSTGFFVYDAFYTHPNSTQGIWNKVPSNDPSEISGTYAARAAGNVSLLSLSLNLLGSNVNYIALTNTSNTIYNVEIPSPQVSNSAYNVPSDGIYQINYSFRTGQGVSAELLTGARPGLIITKTTAGTTTALDYRYFGSINLLDLGGVIGLNLVVANITISQGQISHIYKLKAGDILRFGIVQGGLNLGLVTDKSTELSIYKIK